MFGTAQRPRCILIYSEAVVPSPGQIPMCIVSSGRQLMQIGGGCISYTEERQKQGNLYD